MSAIQLPELAIEAKAELITNNLPEFEKAFRDNLKSYNYLLVEDDDFKKAKADIKSIKEAEDNLKAVDQAIVNGSLDIKELREAISKLGEEARTFRLAREKEVKTRDQELKDTIVSEALDSIDHPKRVSYKSEILGSMKGKKSLATMNTAAEAIAKTINEGILSTRAIIDEFVKTNSSTLVPDRLDLEMKDAESVTPELSRRLEKQADELEKKQLKEAAEAAEKKAKQAEEAHGKTALINTGVELPPPPKIDTIPVKNTVDPQTSEDEMKDFVELVKTAFSPIREARSNLSHDTNIAKAARFSSALAQAWKEFTS